MRNAIFYILFAFALTSCGTTHLIVDDGVYTPVPTTTVVYKYNYAPCIYAPHKYVYHPSYNRSFLTKPYDPKRRPSYSKPSPKPDKPRHDRPNRKSNRKTRR